VRNDIIGNGQSITPLRWRLLSPSSRGIDRAQSARGTRQWDGDQYYSPWAVNSDLGDCKKRIHTFFQFAYLRHR
jgi:hypothetical protein